MCVSPAAGMHVGPLQMFLEVNNSFIKKGHRRRPVKEYIEGIAHFLQQSPARVAHYNLTGAFYCSSLNEKGGVIFIQIICHIHRFYRL